MKTNKWFLVLLIFLVFMSLGMISFAESDTLPPTLNAISVNKTSVTVGDVYTLTVNVTDDISGVSYVGVKYISPSGDHYKNQTLHLDSGDNYKGDFTVGQYDESGVWTIDYILVYDVADNTKYYRDGPEFDFSPGDITFSDTTPDDSAPTLNTIGVDKESVTVGDVYTLTVNVTDDISGVSYVGVKYISPSGKYYKNQTLHLDSGDNYEGDFTVGQYDESGVWTIDYILVYDVADNTKYYRDGPEFDFSPGDITFFDTTPDDSAPTLNTIGVDKESVTVGDVYTLTVNVTDDVSGVSYVGAKYISPSGNHVKLETLHLDSGDNYKGDFTVGEYDELGVWTIDYIVVYDVANNVEYCRDGPELDFSPGDILFKPYDEEPPVISINISDGAVLPIDTILEYSALDNESGLKSVTATLYNGNEAIGIGIPSPYTLTDGIYSLEIIAEDNAGNFANTFIEFVIFDPDCVSVTGGGWINSPSGSYLSDPELSGKASFSFISKYKKNSVLPIGNVTFEFPTGGLEFQSTSYDWLVVSDSRAQFKGSGTINNSGSYGFIITVIDGDLTLDTSDRFRIEIWDKSDSQIIYDNSLNDSETGDLIQDSTLIHGNITIHKK